jgi:hypothetical protein
MVIADAKWQPAMRSCRPLCEVVVRYAKLSSAMRSCRALCEVAACYAKCGCPLDNGRVPAIGDLLSLWGIPVAAEAYRTNRGGNNTTFTIRHVRSGRCPP